MSRFEMHSHSMYSLLDGYATPEEYFNRAVDIGLKGFCITEHGNTYSWVYFDEIKHKYPSVKMCYGVEFYECFDINVKDNDNKYFHLVAIAKNEQGRIALNELVTKSNFEGFYYKPRVDLNMLKPYADNLIISSACLASKIAREEDYNKCLDYVMEYKSIFPYFYLEIQSHSHEDQSKYNNRILELAKDTNTAFVITTDSHAATKEDLYYQGRHVQIAQDRETMSEFYEGCYLQSCEEIHNILDSQIGLDNVNIGLQNTLDILDIIEDVHMPFQEPQLPDYPLPVPFNNTYDYLVHLVSEGWNMRNIDILSDEEIQIRKDRLAYELDVILQTNYAGYFLIIWDFIKYARDSGVAIGAGRGSGAGSLICYLLRITDIDPIKYNLIFERFLNIERISLPDLDIDVGDRELVINYLINKYGEERVCQIINFSYITPVVAIKDVGRVLKMPYNICDKISKLFAYDTFEEGLEHNLNLLIQYPEYDDWFNIASKLSGRVRQASIHAAGVGIVNTKITDYMAMKLGNKNEHVIQVNKKIIERIGIVKIDVLGVQTLNLVQQVVRDAGIDFYDININNPKFEYDNMSYELLSQAQTNGVFQVESQGMKDLLLRLKPQNMEELSAVIALYRPDTMSLLENYIKYKYNSSNITYLHKDMIPLLSKTYGQCIYQEQLLDIVKTFGGRTYGGADKFRKGIGAKNKALVLEESAKLYNEIINTGYEEVIAKTISDDLAEKGGYMFNKSHAMSYAVLCLQTAYLKIHYPLQFFKALLNINKDDYGTLTKYMLDAKDCKVEITPPKINKSDRNFSISEDKILFGLEAIKGVGEKLVDNIIGARENDIFKGIDDFVNRVSPNIAQIVALVKSGAIPTSNKRQFLLKFANSLFKNKVYEPVSTLPTHKELLDKWGIDAKAIKNKVESLRLYNEKKEELFLTQQEMNYNNSISEFENKYLTDEELWEFESLSVFVTKNPFDPIYNYIKPFEEIDNGKKAVIVGVISDIVKKKDRNKNQFAYISLYSAFGVIEITCWASNFETYNHLIKKGNKVVVRCNKKDDQAFVDAIKTFDEWLRDLSGNYKFDNLVKAVS